MGSAHSSCSLLTASSTQHFCFPQPPICVSKLRPANQNQIRSIKFTSHSFRCCSSPQNLSLRCNQVGEFETQVKYLKTMADIHGIDQELLNTIVYDALVWSSLHGLVVGDKSVKVSVSAVYRMDVLCLLFGFCLLKMSYDCCFCC